MSNNSWSFYGRSEQLAELESMLKRNRWFFAKVTGRRRIGKTTLIQRALQLQEKVKPVFYVQIPDSEPAGVLSAVADALDMFKVPFDEFPRPRDMLQLSKLMEAMMMSGYVIVIDEFQYFNRKGYSEFCSYLQGSVDRISAKSASITGGLIVLGSIHTEMTALLDDRSAPLYNRITDTIQLSHLDISSVFSIIQDHAEPTPERLLFLWNLFEGVPKFYRDCYEQGVLGEDRCALVRRMFFESSSPLRFEAENWFMRELRGRFDIVLKHVARHPGRTHSELVNAIREASGSSDAQVGGYLKILSERYALIERKLPIFAKPDARRSRYYLSDNFLRAWLAALANPVAAIAFRPLDQLVQEADARLQEAEGGSLEKLVAALYEERSRRTIGDFAVTRRIQGFWDKAGTEIDLVAVNEESRIIRFASCKRQASKLLSDVNNFKSHVGRFLTLMPMYQSWKIEYAGVAPRLNQDERKILSNHGLVAEDIIDLVEELV